MKCLTHSIGWLKRLTHFASRYVDAMNIVVITATIAISFTSVGIAFKAFRFSQLHNRPFVTLEVIPIAGQYLTAQKSGDSAFIGYSLKFKNEGLTPALNLTFPTEVGLGTDAQGNPVQKNMSRQPQPLALAAGEEHVGVMGMVVPLTGTNTDIVEKVDAGNIKFTIDLTIRYEGLVDSKAKYYTGYACEIGSRELKHIGLSLR